MYADCRLLPPLSQGSFQELHASYHHHLILPLPDDGFLSSFQSILPSDNTPHMGVLVQNPTVMEYDLGGEGDLFKAPEPIMGGEAVFAAVNPVTSAMSMISFGDEVISAETIKVADMESIQSDHLSDFIYDCKEFLAKSGIEAGFARLPDDVKEVHGVGAAGEEDHPVKRTRIVPEGPMQKSVSAECLSSMDWINVCGVRPDFLGFQGLDFGAAFGMRRAYSEGDIQTLSSNNNHSNGGGGGGGGGSGTSIVTKREERREKLFRFWEKKSKRNFGRKIKYACRKALADSQPRVRGRFAKTEDSDVSKPYK